MLYPGGEIKLVGFVSDVDEGDDDEGGVTVVVEPLSHSGGDGNDVALPDFANLLVFLLALALAL